ncbi:MAG: hypothetical protein HYY18_11115 [Planctomycetes bacterium]|nr:hypothetical protein [Planctomycetota bacterium]
MIAACALLFALLNADEVYLEMADDDLTILWKSPHFEVRVLATALTPANLSAYERYAKETAEGAETARDAFFGEMGYPVPGCLADALGDSPKRRQVILIQSLEGELGHAAAEVVYAKVGETNVPAIRRIAVNIEHPDYLKKYGAIPAEVATHELFHVAQFAYDWRESGWLMEATATAMTDQGNPEFAGKPNCGVASRAPVWYKQPEKSLFHNPKTDNHHAYAAGLFFEHLIERHGRDVMRGIWERCAAVRGDNSLEAIDTELRARGSSLEEAFHEFAAAVPRRKFAAEYEPVLATLPLAAESEKFPPPWRSVEGALEPRKRTLAPLSSFYLSCTPAAPFEGGPLTALAGFSPDIRFSLLVRHADGSWSPGNLTSQPFEPGDLEAVLVVVNTHRSETREAAFALFFDPPPAVKRVQVTLKGATVYEAELTATGWRRTSPEEPLPVKRDDPVVVVAETTRRARGMVLALEKGPLPMKSVSADGRRWMVSIPPVDLAVALSERLWLSLPFRAESLDADALTSVSPRAAGGRFVLDGLEGGTDCAHGLLLRHEDARLAPGTECLCHRVPPGDGEFVAARCEGKFVRQATFAGETGLPEETAPPAGVRVRRGAEGGHWDAAIVHDEKTGMFLWSLSVEMGEVYVVNLTASVPAPPGETDLAARARELGLATDPSTRLYATGPAPWENVSHVGTSGTGQAGVTSGHTGTIRFTRFGPRVFEGHLKAPFVVNHTHIDGETSRVEVKAQGSIEICFRVNATRRIESTGALEKRIREAVAAERRKKEEVLEAMVQVDRDRAAALRAEVGRIRSGGDGDLEAARRAESEFWSESSARQSEAKRARDESLKVMRLELEEGFWRESLKKAPVAPFEVGP